MIRKLFRESPIFYSLYFHLYRKHRGIRPPFFTAESNLYFDGYPRSGNTFLFHLIKKTFKDLNTVHHLHSVAPIKMALSRDLPCYILIRDPMNSISSNYLKHYSMRDTMPDSVNISLIKQMTIDYNHYYSYVETIRNKLSIILFEDLINNPIQTIIEIRNNLKIEISDVQIEEFVQNALSTYRGATDKYGSSKPNRHKEVEKRKIMGYLSDFDSYKKSLELYSRISVQS